MRTSVVACPISRSCPLTCKNTSKVHLSASSFTCWAVRELKNTLNPPRLFSVCLHSWPVTSRMLGDTVNWAIVFCEKAQAYYFASWEKQHDVSGGAAWITCWQNKSCRFCFLWCVYAYLMLADIFFIWRANFYFIQNPQLSITQFPRIMCSLSIDMFAVLFTQYI